MTTVNNYFEAEEAIIDRLKVEVPSVLKFYTPFSLEDMVEASQASPSIHVIYGGDRLASSSDAGNGARSVVNQQWIVVLALRTARAQLQNTQESRVLAGQLIPLILRALQGWAPVTWMRPLSRVSGPIPGYTSSFAYFPFAFEGRILT